MNKPPAPQSGMDDETWMEHVKEVAQRFEYPPTPDIAGAVRDRLASRRRAVFTCSLELAGQLAAILLLLALGIALLVPDIRARAFDWLSIGAVRFVHDTPNATHTPEPGLDMTPVSSWFDWADKVSLAEARTRVDFRIPDVPRLGSPDDVFYVEYEPGVAMVILVWEPDEQPPISLHLIAPENRAFKYSAQATANTTVNGQPAVWLSSPHLYEIVPQTGNVMQRFVVGNVLIWEMDDMTYRLEGDLTLAAAQALAESVE
jgi:hypothetical protein